MPIVYGGAIYGIGGGGGGSGGGISGGTANRLTIWTGASSVTSHPGLGADAATGALTIGAQSDVVPVTLRAYSSGTSHIAQWQTAVNEALGYISHTGGLGAPSLASLAGSDLAVSATAPAATTGASQAGKSVTITASPAVASTDTAGAAAGGSVTITAGAAARYTSGNANGGDINLTAGAGIGTGTSGRVITAASGVQIGSLYKNYYGGSPAWGLFWEYSGVLQFGLKQGAPRLGANTALAWESGSDVTLVGSDDLYLYRDAARTLAQRNGTNAQTYRIYGTYTDASNYVRASLAATSTAVTLAAETAGTGADDIDVNVTAAGAGDTRLKIGTADRAVIAGGTVTLTESSATPILDVAVASNTVAGGTVWYTIRADDATNFQALRGQVQWSAVNKGGTLTAAIVLVGSEILAASAGTLTNTATITTGTNLITINLNAVSSLTQTTLYAYVSAQADGTGTVTTK